VVVILLEVEGEEEDLRDQLLDLEVLVVEEMLHLLQIMVILELMLLVVELVQQDFQEVRLVVMVSVVLVVPES
jgi:uncharacterized membrane protein (DUF373 family)